MTMRTLIIAMAMLIPSADMLHAQTAQYDATPVVERVIEQAVRPGFTELSKQTDAMLVSAKALCAAPDESALSQAKSDFGKLIESWGKVEMIRLGPLASDNNLERMLFWPDRRGRGLKQVRDAIRTSEETVQDATSLAGKSVALQGLLALEFTLFGTNSDTLMTADGSDRCAYAVAISHNIANIANALATEWKNDAPDGISSLWLNPSDENPLFRDSREQMSALFKIIGDGLEVIRVQRLDPFLRSGIDEARPKSALFWRSSNSIRSIHANIEGLEAILAAARLDAVASDEDDRIIGSLFFEFKNAKSALASIQLTNEQIVESEPEFNKLNYARIVVNGMDEIVREQLSPAFGLSSGFSSLDGD